MQRVMNDFFFMMFFLVIESGIVHLLYKHKLLQMNVVNQIDNATVLVAFLFATNVTLYYYKDSQIYNVHQVTKKHATV